MMARDHSHGQLPQQQHHPPRHQRRRTAWPGLRMLLLLLGLLLAWAAAVARAYDGTDLGAPLIKTVEHSPCVRLFHSKGSTGCRTPTHEGTTVPLYYLGGFSAADQRAFQALPEPVGVVFPAALLNGTVLEFLAAHAPRLTAGVIVLEEEEEEAAGTLDQGAFSPDVTTPQGQGTPSAALTIGPTHAWNPRGNGIALQDYAFPVVLATGPSAAEVKGWAQHNGGLTSSSPYPRYKATFQFYFGPAHAPPAASPNGKDTNKDDKKPLTSTDCLAWRDAEGQPRPQCLPMGGQSVWASLGGRTGLRTKPTVLLTAAMDGTALFHDRARAANEAAASVLTLLAAVGALSNASAAGRLDLGALEGNIAVALFQADEWGFAGSRRFAQDITSFACEVPLAGPANASRDGAGACLRPARPSLAFQDWDVDNLAHVLAVDQVGVLASAEAPYPLTAIYDAASGDGAPTELLDALAAAVESMDGGTAVALGTYDGDGALPPTPLTSLVKAAAAAAAAAGGAGGARLLSGAVLAGYSGPAFIDPAYHSHRDTGARLLATNATASLAAVATLVARSAVLLAGGTAAAAGTVQAEEAFVTEMLACLTADWACPRLMAPLRKSEIANLRAYLGRPSMYTPPVPKQRPASFYAGVFASYQGQPIVQTPGGLFGAWPGNATTTAAATTGEGDQADAKVYAVPKPLESFLRPWLAATISAADPRAFQQQPPVACARSADCSAGGEACDGGLSTFECLAGTCVCRSLAFYHLALDPGLGPTEAPDAFAVVVAEGAPNWAEPNWAAIGVSVYPDASRAVESAAVGLGVGVAAASAVLALLVQRALTKGHYFD